MAILFWVSVGLLVFHYLGYPMLMGILARILKPKPLPVLQEFPSVTLVISAYNEEDVIAERMENCLSIDYPRDKLDILVVSDHSLDNTNTIVKQYAINGIYLHEVKGRVGKTAALNEVITELDTDIVVFTDANSMLQPDALQKLVRHFADPNVGAVCGKLKLAGGIDAENTYWRYENLIKQWESRVSTLTVFNGALYGLRRQLHRPLNPQASNDFQHPGQVALQGFRCAYEPAAIAEESTGRDEGVEFRRRVRIICRGWRGMFSNIQVLNPLKSRAYAFQLIARKLLRWLGPVFMILILISNWALYYWSNLYKFSLVLQGIFYGAAILGFVFNRLGIKFCLTNQPYYFCLINFAALIGLIRFIGGYDSAVWTPTSKLKLDK